MNIDGCSFFPRTICDSAFLDAPTGRQASMPKPRRWIHLADCETGKSEGRYVDAELPALPFDDGEFDLALCSHFLFLYSEQFSEEFHLAAIREMNRVAGEVRIFPLLALGGAHSPYLEPVSHQLRNDRRTVTIDVVPYEFQRGGNQMMRVRSAG
jgi:hypothetical protein